MTSNTIRRPQVSAILCVFNGERFLAEAIESTLRQTVADLEFLIVDNGSTDATPAVLEDYASGDERIRVLNQQRTSIAVARNRAIREARGRYMAVIDADDISEPSRFEEEVSFLERHPDHAAVGAAMLLVDPDGDPLCYAMRPENHEAILAGLLVGDGVLPHPSAMVRMDPLRHIGGYREEFTYALDLDLWLRLSEHGRLANLHTPLLRYRQHFSSVTASRRELQLDFARRAVADARARRGLPAAEQLRGRVEQPPAEKTMRRWARSAMQAGFYKSAWKHARSALLRAPWSPANWSLAATTRWTSLRRDGRSLK